MNLTIENTFKLINDDQLKNISKVITQAHQLNIFAIGSTFIPALDFNYKMQKLKINSFSNPDYRIQYVQAKNSNEHDVALGISYSGETKETIRFLDIAKKSNSYTILITSNQTIPNNKYDEILLISNNQLSTRIFTLISRISMMAVLDMLYIQILNQDFSKNLKLLKDNEYKE